MSVFFWKVALCANIVVSPQVALTIAMTTTAAELKRGDTSVQLPIEPTKPPGLHILDWIVLGVYGAGILGVGLFYSRVKSVEDYLLGGRDMKPWAVGISLYATLMSTLSYLAMPGEMIRHGPMILSGIFSYPLVYLVVSRLIIPFIMRLRVTTAYEILELRFGLGVRMLGSALFLIIRLLWMSLIVYATSSVVLVPLFQFDESMTPWISAVMAIVAITYATLGGLRAVVVADVLQTSIMLVGAVISVLMITRSLGGVLAWWPTSWSTHWDSPTIFFAADARLSIGLAILTNFCWYVCTVGSDQMAIQRYLATRDAKAASAMFGISLWCDAAVCTLLAIFGLALYAYFRANPTLLIDGQDIYANADQLLPLFVMKVLPAGLSGLVVAGMLSAAMDSLSSGVNASCSVITVDWIDRFGLTNNAGGTSVRQAKVVSWLVGLAVLLLSLCAGAVGGNLLEKTFTVANLFTAPLFVLFVMAMFIPWATIFGTWIGTTASAAVAIAIAYGGLFGLSFLWITPLSLAIGILFGCLASLVPLGIKRPMLEMD